MRLETANGRKLELGRQVGAGGQGTVFHVNGMPSSAVKLYHHPSYKLQAKVSTLVSTPRSKRPSERFAAWPTDIVYEISGPWFRRKRMFAGCIMPFKKDSHPIFHFYTPKKRKEHNWAVNWGHMHLLAHNLASVFQEFHDHNMVIGDVNSRNILVNTALLPIVIDIDSIQISPAHTSDVGVEEYTPPELMGQTFTNVVRNKYHDLFGLGYLLFQLLMNGCSPFAGVPKVDLKSERVDLRCKELGIFPFFENPYVVPPPGMPDVNVFHPHVATGLSHCFVWGRKNPDLRPSAEAWQATFGTAEKELIRCKRKHEHVYSSHLNRCPWC